MSQLQMQMRPLNKIHTVLVMEFECLEEFQDLWNLFSYAIQRHGFILDPINKHTQHGIQSIQGSCEDICNMALPAIMNGLQIF